MRQREHAARDAAALALVRVQQPCACGRGASEGKLPAKIEGVLNTRVHALASRWRVGVSGVTDQVHPTPVEAVGETVLKWIPRGPREVGDPCVEVRFVQARL
jgi:hypothetical protein